MSLTINGTLITNKMTVPVEWPENSTSTTTTTDIMNDTEFNAKLDYSKVNNEQQFYLPDQVQFNTSNVLISALSSPNPVAAVTSSPVVTLETGTYNNVAFQNFVESSWTVVGGVIPAGTPVTMELHTYVQLYGGAAFELSFDPTQTYNKNTVVSDGSSNIVFGGADTTYWQGLPWWGVSYTGDATFYQTFEISGPTTADLSNVVVEYFKRAYFFPDGFTRTPGTELTPLTQVNPPIVPYSASDDFGVIAPLPTGATDLKVEVGLPSMPPVTTFAKVVMIHEDGSFAPTNGTYTENANGKTTVVQVDNYPHDNFDISNVATFALRFDLDTTDTALYGRTANPHVMLMTGTYDDATTLANWVTTNTAGITVRHYSNATPSNVTTLDNATLTQQTYRNSSGVNNIISGKAVSYSQKLVLEAKIGNVPSGVPLVYADSANFGGYVEWKYAAITAGQEVSFTVNEAVGFNVYVGHFDTTTFSMNYQLAPRAVVPGETITFTSRAGADGISSDEVAFNPTSIDARLTFTSFAIDGVEKLATQPATFTSITMGDYDVIEVKTRAKLHKSIDTNDAEAAFQTAVWPALWALGGKYGYSEPPGWPTIGELDFMQWAPYATTGGVRTGVWYWDEDGNQQQVIQGETKNFSSGGSANQQTNYPTGFDIHAMNSYDMKLYRYPYELRHSNRVEFYVNDTKVHTLDYDDSQKEFYYTYKYAPENTGIKDQIDGENYFGREMVVDEVRPKGMHFVMNMAVGGSMPGPCGPNFKSAQFEIEQFEVTKLRPKPYTMTAPGGISLGHSNVLTQEMIDFVTGLMSA